jgi:hypothetical protein
MGPANRVRGLLDKIGVVLAAMVAAVIWQRYQEDWPD